MAVVGRVFFDTTVLIAGLIDLGPDSHAAQAVMTAVASGALKRPLTAWHCCLEFYSVATRLPPELRLTAADAARLLEEEVMARCEIVDLPSADRHRFVRDAVSDRVTGGRVYDLHIAEVARAHRTRLVVTDNARHFSSLLRYDIRVLSTPEFAEELSG